MFTADQAKAFPPLNAKNPGKNEENRFSCGFCRRKRTKCTISGAKINTVYHSLWREKTPARVQRVGLEANKRLFPKNSKNIGEKYMKVVTNGGLWCILIVSLGEVYPFIIVIVVILTGFHIW